MNELINLFSDLYERFCELEAGASIQESSTSFRIFDTSINADADIQLLSRFRDELENNELGKLTIEGEVIDVIDIDNIDLGDVINDNIRITVNKSTEVFVYFLVIEEFSKNLRNGDFIYETSLIYVNEEFEPFCTYNNRFASLVDALEVEEFNSEKFDGLKDPRRLVRDLTVNNSLLPKDISCWLLNSSEGESRVLQIWKKEAAINLSLSLPLQIIARNEHHEVVLKDEKFHSFQVKNFENDIWENVYHEIEETAHWVYKNRDEAESKHAILNYHLALEWSEDEEYPHKNNIAKSLNNAKQAYTLHLHESSKEVLRSLSELRRALFDEVEKVKENTRNLLERLWRDFAIALGVIVIRLVPNIDSIPNQYLDYVSYGTSGFILSSILITISSNFFFNKTAKQSREKWRERIFFYISKDEFNEIYQSPIDSSLLTFRIVQGTIFIIYLALSASLFVFAYCDI